MSSDQEPSLPDPKPKRKYQRKKKVQKQGKVVVSASAGSKYDKADDRAGAAQEPEVTTSYDVPARVFKDHSYSKVGVNLGMTRSLGNYEFARVDVYLEDFCERGQKESTFEDLNKQGSKMLGKVVKDIDAFLKKKREAGVPLSEVKT